MIEQSAIGALLAGLVFQLQARQLRLTDAPFRDPTLKAVTASPVRQFVSKV
jgi:hypothetical protein